MSFRIRAARDEDLQPLYEMAKLTGGGFTNLPPDKHALEAKLDRSRTSFAREEDTLGDDLFVLILENVATGEVRGTCQMFTRVGQRSEEHTSELQSLMRISYAVFCLKKKKIRQHNEINSERSTNYTITRR